MGHRRRHLVLSLVLALLLIAATAHGGGHARARRAGAIITQQGTSVGSTMRSMVGSMPPSCEGRCWWCGGRRCEAVQVPITPQEQDKSRRHGHGTDAGGAAGSRSTREGSGGALSSSSSSSSSAQHQHQLRRRPSTSSYDDRSNYKPLSWRCKCGGG